MFLPLGGALGARLILTYWFRRVDEMSAPSVWKRIDHTYMTSGAGWGLFRRPRGGEVDRRSGYSPNGQISAVPGLTWAESADTYREL